MSPMGSGVPTLGLQMAALFREGMEPLGGGALLEEVCQLGWDLRVYSFSLHPVLAPCFLCVSENVASHLLTPVSCCCASSAETMTQKTQFFNTASER